MLEARKISVNYDEREAVADVSLRADAGRMIAIIGPNGAGKSTVLRALNGSIRLSRGEVLLDERRIESYARRAVARQIALVGARCDRGDTAAVVVTHDVNLASEFADRVVLMKEGRTIAMGSPHEALTPELLRNIFDLQVLVDTHPISGAPRITPVHDWR